MMFSLKRIRVFKKNILEVLQHATLRGRRGLCKETGDYAPIAYLMGDTREYRAGIGPDGVFTDERVLFCMLIDRISAQDLQDMMAAD
jgi:hypothetical protein